MFIIEVIVMKKRLAEKLISDENIKLSRESELQRQLDLELAKNEPDYDRVDELVNAVLAERQNVPDAGEVTQKIAAIIEQGDNSPDEESVYGVEIYHRSRWQRFAAAAAAVILVAGAGTTGILLLGSNRNVSPEMRSSEYVTAKIQDSSITVSAANTAPESSQPIIAETTAESYVSQTTIPVNTETVTNTVTSATALHTEKQTVTTSATALHTEKQTVTTSVQDNVSEVAETPLKTLDPLLFTETTAVNETLEVNGTEIPSGSVAVSVKLNEKKLFSTAEMSFTLSGYEPVTDSSGRPALTTTAYNDEFAAAGSVSGSKLFFDCVYYSFHDEPYNGELFTFYVKPTGENPTVTTESFSVSEAVQPETYDGSDKWYVIGDINGDGEITPADAAAVIKTLNNVNSILQYEVIKRYPEYYFPDIVSLHAAYIWNTPDEMIKEPVISNTAKEILAYCTDRSVGKEYSGKSYIGCKYYK